jgi:hypothetical protein
LSSFQIPNFEEPGEQDYAFATHAKESAKEKMLEIKIR